VSLEKTKPEVKMKKGCIFAVLFAGMFHIKFMLLAVWMFFVLIGALVMLGLPNIHEWRLLTDDRL